MNSYVHTWRFVDWRREKKCQLGFMHLLADLAPTGAGEFCECNICLQGACLPSKRSQRSGDGDAAYAE